MNVTSMKYKQKLSLVWISAQDSLSVYHKKVYHGYLFYILDFK